VVHYLGVGGFLLKHGDDIVLTAPMYTNPSLVEVLAEHEIRPDSRQVDRYLPREADGARAILVGHSHYDHLLDVSDIALRRAREARIYGSRTMKHLLAPFSELGSRVVAIDDKDVGDARSPGEWLEVAPRVRVMALRSEHSTQVTLDLPIIHQPVPIHLWRGGLNADLTRPPRTASEWAEGTVYAYLIDFLEEPKGRTAFRVYFQDSGTNQPQGYVPDTIVPAKRVDVALLCVGGDFERLRRHPEGILENTRSRYVLLGHWEDFFVTQDNYEIDGQVYPVPSFERDTEKFLKRAERKQRQLDPASKVWIPCPTRSRFAFAPESARLTH
jgi:hypothetical protein